MQYNELKNIYQENLAKWKEYEKELEQSIHTVFTQFLLYLQIREQDGLLSMVPFNLEKIFEKKEFSLPECLDFLDEGWVGTAFRLAMGEDAYIIRFEIKKDESCWILHGLNDQKEYLFSEIQSAGFFENITDYLQEIISKDFECWQSGEERPLVEFIVEEKVLKSQLTATQINP
jgi:hypothetical protein